MQNNILVSSTLLDSKLITIFYVERKILLYNIEYITGKPRRIIYLPIHRRLNHLDMYRGVQIVEFYHDRTIAMIKSSTAYIT